MCAFKKEATELKTLFDRFDDNDKLVKSWKNADRKDMKIIRRKKRFLTCGCCNKRETASSRLWRCKKCDTQYYCSKECQTKHWTVHKHVCRPVNGMKS